jgi:Tfp pilus assembly protein PilF
MARHGLHSSFRLRHSLGIRHSSFVIPFFLSGLLAWLLCVTSGLAGPFSPATVVKEYERVFTTYPYSDPDPVPAMSRYYPYFRYDGFTEQSVAKKWQVVELSNAYVQLLILPEIGGKVWAAIERKTGHPFLYFNHVVKFRDVSMRGPWTSGGMEANYGIIGHTPNCFSPVDYAVKRYPDGSASCIIGTLDLLTRTTWHLEINLPADQSCFTTRSFWHNGSVFEQPYYTWMNVGLKASGNLQFINPGTRYLGHDGEVFDWPVNPENGHDLSWYEQNDFGPYKSYHVFGRLSEFFGGYYQNEDFGMAHYADYADKPGRKIWIWGLSRQGMIWTNLLTDTDGQYVEVQSGRLFNQTADESTLTPFKHHGFPPHATDSWTEYWEPVAGTKGFVSASPWGAMNVTYGSNQLVIRISAARPVRDLLEVMDGTNRLWSKEVALKPMQTVANLVPLAVAPNALKVSLGGGKLQYDANADDALSRPVAAPGNFDWQSTYGLYLSGEENCREREYLEAATNYQASLQVDPNFAPALVELAALANRRAGWATARDYARKALSIDTYDPGANYQFGIASAGLGRQADAKDAFSVAALSTGWRSAADTELAKEFLREKQYDRALKSAEASLDNDRRNVDALQIKACVGRIGGHEPAAESACRTLLELDPLNHFARFERFLRGKARSEDFINLIRNELPQETYLELSAWYRNAGLDQDAAQVLELAPPTAEVLYWLAYLRHDTNLLARAASASPAFVFPFRTESVPVFEWAGQMSRAWQPRYFLALIRWYQGELVSARKLFAACGDEPPFGPFYAARAQVVEENTVHDLERAAQLDPTQWRYGVMLAKHCLAQTNPAAALSAASRYATLFPRNHVLALLYAKTLVLNGQYQAAADLLGALKLIPCEGSTDARAILREAYLMLALQQMKAGSSDEALRFIAQAREWPEHLGAGKPYAEDIDERLEDWLACQCNQNRNPQQAQLDLDKILTFGAHSNTRGTGSIIRALALKRSGRTAEAEGLLNSWPTNSVGAKMMAAWGKEILSGNAAPAPNTVLDSDARILAAWVRQAMKP